MRIPILSALSLAFITLTACGDSATSMDMAPAAKPLNEQLVGTWNSMSCEPAFTVNTGTMMLALYTRRTYNFTSSTEFDLTADLFADQSCSSLFRLLRVDAKGTFTVGNDVSAVSGAKEINFTSTVRGVMPTIDMARQLLNMINCGGSNAWMVNQRQDVASLGCDPLVPSTSSCPKEFDIALLVDASTLKFGTRPMSSNGLCTGRPTTAGLALVKQ